MDPLHFAFDGSVASQRAHTAFTHTKAIENENKMKNQRKTKFVTKTLARCARFFALSFSICDGDRIKNRYCCWVMHYAGDFYDGSQSKHKQLNISRVARQTIKLVWVHSLWLAFIFFRMATEARNFMTARRKEWTVTLDIF